MSFYRALGILTACLGTLFIGAAVSGSVVANQSTGAEQLAEVTQLKGVVTLSTSADKKWTFISIPSKNAGQPLAAAFAIQYVTAAARPVSFSGLATLKVTKFALQVSPASGEGWIFELSEYRGSAPRETITVKDIAGIVRFDAESLNATIRPVSHADFVARAGAIFSKALAGNLDDCRSGGFGALACNLSGDSSVACSQGFAACCNPGGCVCLPETSQRHPGP